MFILNLVKKKSVVELWDPAYNVMMFFILHFYLPFNDCVFFLAITWPISRPEHVAFKQKHICVRLPLMLFLILSEVTKGRNLVA
jgi:hypothetical protein